MSCFLFLDILAKIEKCADLLIMLFHECTQINCNNMAVLLQRIIQCLDCIVTLLISHRLALNDDLSRAISELIYLPWLQCIDPPWFDWKPLIHDQTKLKALKIKLDCHISLEYIQASFHLMLQMPPKDHQSWKMHIFRVALVSLIMRLF